MLGIFKGQLDDGGGAGRRKSEMGNWPEMMPKGGWRGAAYLGPCRSRGLCLIP